MTEIRPGDTVLLPVVMGMSLAEIGELRAELADAFPGVRWSIQRETMTTEALVYRAPVDAQVDDGEAERLRVKLNTALDLIGAIAGRFDKKGSVGALDNVLRTGWVKVEQVQLWRTWVRETREALKASDD